jgi:hypothetical protein
MLLEGSQGVGKLPVVLSMWDLGSSDLWCPPGGCFLSLTLYVSVSPISVFMYSRVLFPSFPPLILLVQGRINRVIIML